MQRRGATLGGSRDRTGKGFIVASPERGRRRSSFSAGRVA